jgi:hypothetical protein
MLKKMLFAAVAVVAVAVVVAPSASGTILHDHMPLEPGEEPHETFTGTIDYQNAELGRVHCTNVEVDIQLNTAPTTGTVTKFQINEPTVNCHISGALGAICGMSSLHQVNLTKHAQTTVATQPAGADALTMQDIELFTLFGSTASPCVEFALHSTATKDFLLTPTNPTNISTLHLSGSLETPFGPMSFAGTLHPHNPGTWGIEAG